MKCLIKVINYLIIFIFGISAVILFLSCKPITVLSGSMHPTLEAGDLLVIKRSSLSKIKVGDIITFEGSKKILITHRVFKIINEEGITKYITKGDANNLTDQDYVYPEQIFGKYMLKIPYGGYFFKFIRSRMGILIFIIIPAAVLTAEEIKNIIRKDNNREEKK